MFSSATADPMRAWPPHHLHQRHPSDHLHSFTGPPRPGVDLPRPLEPRPTHHLQPSLSDSSITRAAPDAFRNPPPPPPPDYRTQGQSLPRIQDILTSGAPNPSAAAYTNGWSTPAGPPPAHPPPSSHQRTESYHSQNAWHPPLAHPPYEQPPTYQHPSVRRVELPVLETGPANRHDSHSVPLSPYSAYPDSARQYSDARRERPRQASISSYHPNGAPSPYTPAATEESQFRSPATTLDRPPGSAFGPNGTDSTKKYLGVKDVSGEGSFHVYEGGFRIPTHVDGEMVNPAWGLTKANKPRKRLAMACLDCREKKIKCEPGANSCVQCQKAKRPCRKAPIHQSQSDTNTTASWQSNSGSPVRRGIADPPFPNDHEADGDFLNKRRPIEDSSPTGGPVKKHRSASPVFVTDGNVAPLTSIAYHPVSSPPPRSPGKVVSYDDDPFALEPELTVVLLESFFAHINNATYCMFPHHHFMRWLTTHPTKCQNERLVLYAMLAIGSIFADDRCSGFGKHCANIAMEAARSNVGRHSMTFVQGRILLGLYHFAKGANGTACEYVGSAINAAFYLRFHTEQGCTERDDAVDKTRSEFALSQQQLIECKRRTLWCCFLMDSYCRTVKSMTNMEDIFIRLPCSEDRYENGLPSNAPFYNNGIVDPTKTVLTEPDTTSPMTWLVLVAIIWGDVSNFIQRAVHRPAAAYEHEYETFYETTRKALQGWQSQLPEHLQFSQANVERSVQNGSAGMFVSMHVLYHLSWLKLSRHARHSVIPRSISRNVWTCHLHAHELLQVTSSLRAVNPEVVDQEGNRSVFMLTTPFAGDGILAAIDVVGAGGLDTNLKATLDLINCGLECLRELARFWNSARDQDKACEKRYYQIHNVLKHPFTARSGCWLGREWGVSSSLESDFDPEDDCIYGVSDRDYFDALRDNTPNA